MNPRTIMALGGLGAAIALSGCAAVNGTRAGDMTIPGHEAAALAEAEKADEAARRATAVGRGAEYDRYLAGRHRDLANAHAAAAERRRGDVNAACEGARASLPLTSTRVTSVEPIEEADVPPTRRNPRGHYPERLRGARLTVTLDDAAPEEAARAIECEAARLSAGLNSTSAANPLGVRTARTVVRVADSRLLIEVRSDRRGDAEEIVRRAEALALASPGAAR